VRDTGVSGLKKFRHEFEAKLARIAADGHRARHAHLQPIGGRVSETMGPKMVTLTIEGRTAVVPEGTSIIEAAKTVGVLIPHYCYHPGLPVAGVCRMCLVDVEKLPQARARLRHHGDGRAGGACAHREGARSAHRRAGVPAHQSSARLPVCDQAGECELQDYTFQEGRAESRYEEPKRFNPVEDFGGDVMYVPNRCILCTRCVRFMGEVAEDPVLNVSERGDRAFIGKAEGHDLTNRGPATWSICARWARS
jgi:NADH-quinone oxidoreductase subunit G